MLTVPSHFSESTTPCIQSMCNTAFHVHIATAPSATLRTWMFHLNYLLPAKCLHLNLVPGTEVSAPFRLYILTGNITTCYDCKEQFVSSGPHMTSLSNMKRIASSSTQRQMRQCSSEVMYITMSTCHAVYLACSHMCWPSFDLHKQLVIPAFTMQGETVISSYCTHSLIW